MQLVKIWQEVLNVEQVGIRDNFFDLGGHSLQAIRLMAKIQQSFGISLPLSVIFHGATIEQLAHQLHESSPKVWAPLVTIQPDGTHQPFYCVPGAGGNVIYLYELAHLLGNDFPFYGLQSIGLDGKSKPHHRIESMAACYVKQIQQVQPQGPYCLGGHSFGGWVAFEMAQQLQRQGQQISRLVIFDTFLPTTHALNIGHSMTADWNDAQWLVILAEVLEKLIGKSLSISLEIIQPLQPDEQLQYLLERLQQINWLPLETDMRQLRGLVEVYKASTQATYEMPPSVYPTPITLFRAQIPLWKQTKLPTELVEIMQEPTFGWQQVAQGEVEIHEIPGDHITIMTAPSIQILAEKLKRCIASISHKPISH
jgi:thioesterase domain-containing protein/acyl carrier protein